MISHVTFYYQERVYFQNNQNPHTHNSFSYGPVTSVSIRCVSNNKLFDNIELWLNQERYAAKLREQKNWSIMTNPNKYSFARRILEEDNNFKGLSEVRKKVIIQSFIGKQNPYYRKPPINGSRKKKGPRRRR